MGWHIKRACSPYLCTCIQLSLSIACFLFALQSCSRVSAIARVTQHTRMLVVFRCAPDGGPLGAGAGGVRGQHRNSKYLRSVQAGMLKSLQCAELHLLGQWQQLQQRRQQCRRPQTVRSLQSPERLVHLLCWSCHHRVLHHPEIWASWCQQLLTLACMPRPHC